MENQKRLIDANVLLDRLIRIERGCLDIDGDFAKGVRECQHAVISAFTEKAENPDIEILGTSKKLAQHPTAEVRITKAIRTCQNCGALVTFDFGGGDWKCQT